MNIQDKPDQHNQPTTPFQDDDDITLKEIPPTIVPIQPPPPQQPNNPTTQQRRSAGPTQQRLSRRKLIGATALGIAGAGALVGGGAALLAHNGIWNPLAAGPVAGSMQTGHLLRRAGFGARPDEMNTYASLGFQGAVDHLLNYRQISDDALENRLKTLNLDLTKPAQQQQWWLLRMAWTQRPLLEKMTLFWHGLLTSSFHKVGGNKAIMRMIVQNKFFRDHAFDTFDSILLGITADPAMLVYLDLNKSRRNAPNENYARELMELFTIGLGNYTQQDVTTAAAALTGWHVAGDSLTATYQPTQHTGGTKTFLGHNINLDYKDIIHTLTNHPAAPWFLCRKLFTFFVYENPSKEDLQPLVDTYNKSGHNMGAVMRTLLLSPQFSSPKAYRSRLKSPTEFVVGAYRALNIQDTGQGLPTMTTMMGQTLFDPPNVAGWPGDKVSSLWLNSGTWMARLNYIDLMLAGSRNQRTGANKAFDLQNIINANHIDTPERFVDHFVSFLLDGSIAQDRRAQLIDYFTSKDPSARAEQIHLSNGTSYPLSRVRGTLYLLLSSPEYQLN